jgi:alpha-D-ribose 1-methylphosphonate 5-triphosphate diphosphatase
MWLTNLRLLTPAGWLDRGALCLEQGLLREVRATGAPPGAIDLDGLTAIPGLVDLHGDMFEREIHPRPSADIPPEIALAEVDKRLASSGITTAFAAISCAWHRQDFIRSEAAARRYIETLHRERHRLAVDHHVHARFEITNPAAGEVLESLIRRGLVQLVSVMDHTPGQGQYRDIEAYVRFSIEWAKRTEGIQLTPAEAMERIERAASHPKGWEAVRGVSKVARQHGVPLASHDDDSAEKVAFMAGLGCTISEFPVTLEAARAATRLGLRTVMGGPNAFRGQSHSGNLGARDAAGHGLLDALASDYYPPAMLLAAFKLAEHGVRSLAEALEMVTVAPARAAGLTDRGTLEAGMRADVVLLQTEPWPRVRATLRGGVPIYSDGLGSTQWGRL